MVGKTMVNQSTKIKQNRKAWKILFKHLKGHKSLIIRLALLGVISALANGTVPYIIGSFLDAILHFSRTVTFWNITISVWLALLLLWVFVQFMANVVDWIIDRNGRILGTRVELGYQGQALAHLLFVPLSFHKDEKIGALSDLISRTSWQIASITENILIDLSAPILSVIVGILVTLFINPIFTAILIIGILIYILVLIHLIAPTTGLIEEGHIAWNGAYANAFQAVSNIQSVKHMAAEKYEDRKITQSFFSRTPKIWDKIVTVWSNINFYQRIIILVTQTIIFVLSVYFIHEGSLTIGGLVALNGYAAMLFGPFVLLGRNWQTLQNGLVNIQLTEKKIFDTPYEIYHPQDAFTPTKLNGDVEFKDVSFGYDKSTTVLHNLTFKVRQGERVAFVGKSGVGKSTIIDLIPGYYFPTEGKLLVDGHDTREFDLTALRRGIAVVSQEPVLFNDSVMMNIRYGRLDATNEEVIEAAKNAHAHDFIEELPMKYEQLVGERGIKLSVGQKQRIAIARAILRNPRILILDEPTSALDAQTEKLISKSFEDLMKGRTTFIAAHRLSTIRNMDKIFVLENGQIAEEGKHEDLIRKEGGIYKSLYEYQTEH